MLIAKNEKEIELLVSKKYLRDFDRPAPGGDARGLHRRVQEAGLQSRTQARSGRDRRTARGRPFRGRPFPRRYALAAMRGFIATDARQATGSSPLVIRNQVRLGLAGARAIIAGAEAKATEMKLKVNIAAVDDGGHLVAFERMDGARPASLYTAITKATSAATFRQPTGPLPAGSTPADPLLNISLQNAAQPSGGKVTALLGGVPVIVDGQIIGAVGIAGGTGEQDAQVARAGIQALLDQLARAEEAAKAAKPPEKPE